jgi:glycosyltransferase involved in cell wall biosynthesis
VTRIGAPARTVLVELNGTPSPVDWAAAPLWRVIATADGVPCWAAWIPGPGGLVDPDAFTEATLADARERARELALAEHFERLLGIAEVSGPARTVSVVVCTHRRPAYLPGLLDALTRLDPPPHEVIVVDNDPGERGCEELVAAHGARYVREDRRGLNRARTAGLRAATGEVVAFTDDDCVPPPGWLSRVDGHFADPTVHGVTGPAFAWELETPSQLRFELEGGFNRGFGVRRFDWMTHSPCGSGAVGSGANMIFRRAVLLGLGEPFPPELDAGTATQTGGDMYAIYRVLEAGGRMVFDPGAYVFHRHRRDPAALRRAFRGYGTGIVATMWKVLLERGEAEALVTAYWLWQQYRWALLHRFAGCTDPRSLRVAADYLGGGAAGIGAWYAAVREGGDEATPIEPIEPVAPVAPVAAPAPDTAGAQRALAVSVVIPTVGRPDALDRCLAALPAPGPALEIIVVDDRPAGSPGGLVVGAMPPGVRTLRSGGSGAAGARNAGARAATGEVLVFLDDDLVPAPGLIDRHRAAHAGDTDVFAVGYSPPRPAQDTWVARAAGLWWEDHFAAMARRDRFWATDLLSGNVSLRRERFLALGGFSEQFGRLRREDWLFGATVLRAGVAVRYLPDAVAHHEYTLSTGRRLAAAREEGWGDALLVNLHPELAGAVDEVPARLTGAMATAVHYVVGRPWTIAATTWALDCLERVRLRTAWLTLFAQAQRLLYANGRHKGAQALAGGGQARPPAPPVPTALDPAVEIPLAAGGAVARPLAVAGPGSTRRVSADRGRWTAATASRAARLVTAAGTQRERVPVPATAGLRVALVSSPAHWGPAGPPRAAAAGPELHVRDEADLWLAAATLLAAGDYEAVWVAVPGTRLAAGVGNELLAHSDGDAVSVTVAAAGPSSRRRLHHGLLLPGRWRIVSGPPVMIGIRATAAARLGGLDLDAGPGVAPGLELFERARRAGETVAAAEITQVAHVYARHRPWRAPEWRRQRARGALVARGHADAPLVLDALRAVGQIVHEATHHPGGARWGAVALGGLIHGFADAKPRGGPWRK